MSKASQSVTEEEGLLYGMLSVLKTPISTAERHGVDITPAMFKKPNPKGLAVVMYSLYTLLKGKATAQKVHTLDRHQRHHAAT
jgi:hypothetical protein